MSGVDAWGTLFRRGEGTDPETYTSLANVTNISGPSRSRETIDVTSHDTADGWAEFDGGLKDGGEVTVELNYDPAETTHQLDDDLDDDRPRNYQIVMLPGAADEAVWEFAGVVTELSDEFPYDDKMARTVTIKLTGVAVPSRPGYPAAGLWPSSSLYPIGA